MVTPGAASSRGKPRNILDRSRFLMINGRLFRLCGAVPYRTVNQVDIDQLLK
jgi:hypothetical protein